MINKVEEAARARFKQPIFMLVSRYLKRAVGLEHLSLRNESLDPLVSFGAARHRFYIFDVNVDESLLKWASTCRSWQGVAFEPTFLVL